MFQKTSTARMFWVPFYALWLKLEIWDVPKENRLYMADNIVTKNSPKPSAEDFSGCLEYFHAPELEYIKSNPAFVVFGRI